MFVLPSQDRKAFHRLLNDQTFVTCEHVSNIMALLGEMDDSSTDEETTSQTTEDDPQVPEHNAAAGPSAPAPSHASFPVPAPAQQPVAATQREKPHYALRHVLRGHTQSISAIKFSPDGKLLASCGENLFLLKFISYFTAKTS